LREIERHEAAEQSYMDEGVQMVAYLKAHPSVRVMIAGGIGGG
jgi:hypothetical protein